MASNRRVNEGLDDPLQAVDDAHNMAQRVNNSLARTNILMEGFYRVIMEDLVRRDQIVDRLTHSLDLQDAFNSRIQDAFDSSIIELTNRVASLEAQTRTRDQIVHRLTHSLDTHIELQDAFNRRIIELTDRVASLEAQSGNAGERRSRSPSPRT